MNLCKLCVNVICLFCCSEFYCGRSILKDSMQIEFQYMTRRNLSLFIKCAILANARSFKVAFLQMLDICSLKSRLLSICMPSSLKTEFSPTIVSPPTLTYTLGCD